MSLPELFGVVMGHRAVPCLGGPWQEAIPAFPFAQEAADALVQGIKQKNPVDLWICFDLCQVFWFSWFGNCSIAFPIAPFHLPVSNAPPALAPGYSPPMVPLSHLPRVCHLSLSPLRLPGPGLIPMEQFQLCCIPAPAPAPRPAPGQSNCLPPGDNRISLARAEELKGGMRLSWSCRIKPRERGSLNLLPSAPGPELGAALSTVASS